MEPVAFCISSNHFLRFLFKNKQKNLFVDFLTEIFISRTTFNDWRINKKKFKELFPSVCYKKNALK